MRARHEDNEAEKEAQRDQQGAQFRGSHKGLSAAQLRAEAAAAQIRSG